MTDRAMELAGWAMAIGILAIAFGSQPATKYAGAICVVASVAGAIALVWGK